MGSPKAPRSKSTRARGHRNPVILVHGIMGQRHLYWNLFRGRLQDDGLRVHEAVMPYYMLGDIRIAARFLAEKVDAVLRSSDTERVDLICHSAGGLVARYYLRFLDGHRKVGHLVTLGTPHLGTYVSYVLALPFVSIIRQTRPGSNFLSEINGPHAVPPGVHVTNIWSPTDLVVVPPENGILPGANNIKMHWTSHWGFLWRRDVYNRVIEALGQGAGQATLDQPKPKRRTAGNPV